MALETPVVNLTYKRGDSKAIVFNLTNADGSAKDLTGYTSPVLSVHSEPTPPDVSTEVFKIAGTVLTPETAGQVSFSPSEDGSGSDQTPDLYWYDAQIIDTDTKKGTFVEGTFRLVQDRAKD